MTTTTRTLAVIPSARYDSAARADFVSRGLAVRTIRTLAEPAALVVEIDGSAESARRWIHDHAGGEAYSDAIVLLLSALDSYGADALRIAERARAIVGLDGIDECAHRLADANECESAWTIRGALAALLGDECPELGGAYESEALDGFDFVESGGFGGAWREDS